MTYTQEDFKPRYLSIIGFFYAGQGFSLGSMVLLLPLYILNNLNVGIRSTAVAVAAMIIFPWYVKFIFGIITDNFPIQGSRRKSYLVIATIFSFIGWSTIGLSPNVFPYFFLSGVSIAIGSALGDAVVDGHSIEITPDNYAGRLQGVNWGSRGLGLGAAGYISPNIVDIFGWQALFRIAGVIAVIITIAPLILPELQREFPDISLLLKLKQVYSNLKQIFSKPRMYPRVGFILSTGFTLAIILQLTLIMETEFGYGFNKIGVGALMFAVGTFIGSIVNGIITDRDDTLFGFNVLSVFYAVSIMFGLVFVDYRNFKVEMLFFFLIGLSGGAYEAYQLKVIQEETTDKLESTIFSIYTGISNIGQFAMGSLIIIVIADSFNLSILVSMQLILLFILLSSYFLKSLKFSD